ncbi:MAG TPA: hypothetical protein VFK02_04095 [Kofleriaceae bacterium]|nr:hypothetical protein [Kofleriaceae bacterium]
MTCPGDIELSRALSVGADADLTAHLAGCAACRAAWDEARAAIDLARELPVTVPPASRREEMRTAVLAAAAGLAQRPSRRRWIAPMIVGAAAASVVGYLAVRHNGSAAGHAHGTVRPHVGARFLASAGGPDEVVRLTDGVIDVDVEPLHPGERFRVVVGSAALEVHGTAFTVTAEAGHLVAVAVKHGRVDVQPEDGAPATLATGQSWHATAIAAEPNRSASPAVSVPSPVPAPVAREPVPPPHSSTPTRPHRTATTVPRPDAAPGPAPERTPAERPAPPAPAPGPTRAPAEISYDDAWAALRTGDFARAANGFARAMLLAPDGPLVEDASFWHAVSLARGKRSAEALSAFRDFLDHGASPHAGEASAMLGWLLIDARAYDEAARRFTAAARDRDPAVRRSAQAGLDALAHRKP